MEPSSIYLFSGCRRKNPSECFSEGILRRIWKAFTSALHSPRTLNVWDFNRKNISTSQKFIFMRKVFHTKNINCFAAAMKFFPLRINGCEMKLRFTLKYKFKHFVIPLLRLEHWSFLLSSIIFFCCLDVALWCTERYSIKNKQKTFWLNCELLWFNE